MRLVVTLLAIFPLLAVPASPAVAHGSFWDDDENPHEHNIEAIAAEGITQGCNWLGDRYCPRDHVKRAQMAAFLQDALGLPETDTDYFDDDDGSPFEDAINAIAEDGIAEGCAERRFCPAQQVTRAEMATFLANAFDYPPSDTDHFEDDNGDTHERNINALADQGVTRGCDPDGNRYCPYRSVHRDAMATFLARALDLSAGDPTGGYERILTYTIGTDGNPDAGSFAVFGTRIHQALHGDGGWNIQGRLFFKHVRSGGDFHIWLTDDDNVGNKAPVCSDDWSCTVGNDIYINDQNFASPPSHWGDRVPAYQRYLVNHEVGHYLDFDQRSHYNDDAYCDPAGYGDAPVMMQQSKPSVMTGAGSGSDCNLNVWPLGFERDCVEETWLADETWQSDDSAANGECPE